ncbi:MAG: hypothetical protein LBT24_06480 [Tannerella sp.]|nr:hypothetical protein [Tannerella sp.]
MKLEKGVFRSRKVKNSGKLQKNQKCISVIPEQYLAGQLADCESKKWHGLYEDIYGGNLTALENSGFVHFWGEKLRKDTAEKVDKICWEVIPDMYLKIKNLTNEKK